MGQYHTVRRSGKLVSLFKVGVMDCMRYIRRNEAELFAKFDTGEDADFPSYFADEDTLWRFPWPEEDMDIHSYPHNPSPFIERYLHNALEVECAEIPGIHEQDPIYVYGDGRSWRQLCPRLVGDVAPIILITGVRYNQAGEERTIFSCKYCRKLFSLNEYETLLVKRVLLKDAQSRLTGIENFPLLRIELAIETARSLGEIAKRLKPKAIPYKSDIPDEQIYSSSELNLEINLNPQTNAINGV